MKGKFLRGLFAALGLVIIFNVVYFAALRPWHVRWGATGSELSATLPGDELFLGPQAPSPIHYYQRTATRCLALDPSDRPGPQRFLQLYPFSKPGWMPNAKGAPSRSLVEREGDWRNGLVRHP